MNWLQTEESDLTSHDTFREGLEEQRRSFDRSPRMPAQRAAEPIAVSPFVVEEEIDCQDCGGRGYDVGGLSPNEFEYCPSCLGSCKQLIMRNYLTEAFQIVAGENPKPTERAHVVALVAYARITGALKSIEQVA